MKVVVIFHRLGPYHAARLAAVAARMELTAVELASETREYAWDAVDAGELFRRVTLFPEGDSRAAGAAEVRRRLKAALDAAQPQVVVVPGWSDAGALAALEWCGRHGVPVVVMSESTAWDERRAGWKEWVKRQLVGLCSAGLAGGTAHADYLAQLGLPPERISLGYDAVDNNYFAKGVEKVRGQRPEVRGRLGFPEKYFMASARFIEKKNLHRLIEAYAGYRGKAESRKQKTEIWDLVLLGDGPLRGSLSRQIETLNLHRFVHLPGFKQYPELPAYYGLASAFIHASTTEQWGLVVNEAMASDLPVLVSNRCGCAADLVKDGENGFTFDPFDVEALASLMLKISEVNFPISKFGAASLAIISNWGPERFATGLSGAVKQALAVGARKPTWLQRGLMQALRRR